MSASQPNIEAIFHAARDIPDSDRRREYVREACGGDVDRIDHVEALLEAADRPDSLLDRPAAGIPVATVDQPAPERPGTVIGPYKLLQQIGEGGMGTVWMAQQTEPVKRVVAVKLIKAGMDSKHVIARFEAERQALALMDQPNIARVLDGGTTSAGRPYFVMDLVKGVPITRYCDEHHLTPRQRLELFIPVCQAIQHAHQKGIIHRDLKPSNVLVAPYDGKAVVKVIDFGVAKAAGQQLTDRTLVTGFGAVVGTLEYMSPEQAELNNQDIDTRSDVYALGVLLYELLAGSPPFTRKELEKAGMVEMLRVIREQEPSKPSTKLSTAETLPTLAANRGTEPRKLTAMVRGELDWIVMKALEKDRNRRYETANGFALDVQRYLNDEPVLACPPSAWYRCRRANLRQRARLTVATVVTAALVVAAAAAWWTDRQQAALAAKQQADAARQRAETEQSITAALAEAQTLLAQSHKETAYPERWQATARVAALVVERAERLRAAGEVTDELTARVERTRAAVAAAQKDSQLQMALDRLYSEVLLGDRSDVSAAYAPVFQAYGVNPDRPQEAAARVRASRLREEILAALENWALKSADKAEVERLKQVLAAAEPAPDAFRARWLAAQRQGDDAVLLELAAAPDLQQQPRSAVLNVALYLQWRKHFAAAERLLRTALERFPADFWLNTHLGIALLKQKKLNAALACMTAALAVRHDLPGAHYNLGAVLSARGDQDGAIRQHRIALQMDDRNVPAFYNLGIALMLKESLQESIDAFQTALRIDPKYLPAQHGLGNALERTGDLDGAIRCYEAALQIDPHWAETHYDLGIALKAKKDLKGAVKHFRAATKSDPNNADAHYNLANALEATDLDGARTSYEAAVKINPSYADAHNNLGTVLQRTGHLLEAIRCFEAALKIEPRRADTHYNLGLAHYTKGDLNTAIYWYQAALALNPRSAKVHNNLGIALADKNDLEGAMRCFQAALKIESKYGLAYINLGYALARSKDLEKAISSYQNALQLEPAHGYGHFRLGQALLQQGRFDEAAQEAELALKLLPRGSPYVAEAKGQLQGCQEMAPIAAKLPAVLRGEEELTDAVQTARCAWLCQQPYHQLNVAAAQLYVKAFSADAKLADHMGEQHRYNAACAAILASTGQGKDAAQLKDEERSLWARQALAWLQADLTAYAKLVRTGQPRNLTGVQQRLQHWRKDDDLAAVRAAAAVGRLPAEERRAWTTLWAEVDRLLRSTESKPN
jgi:serine/threonine protein kinase/tetratricopeptide (TPR) repeat protein